MRFGDFFRDPGARKASMVRLIAFVLALDATAVSASVVAVAVRVLTRPPLDAEAIRALAEPLKALGVIIAGLVVGGVVALLTRKKGSDSEPVE